MQLSTSELAKIDRIIERYIDGEQFEVLEGYLNSLEPSERKIMMLVYIQMKRQINNDSERKIIRKHVEKIYQILLEKGVIKNEKQEPTEIMNNERTTRNPQKTAKIERLNRYRELTEILKALHDRLELLQDKYTNISDIRAVDYAKVKTSRSNQTYELKSLDIISDIKETQNLIEHYESEIHQERDYLNQLFNQIPYVREQYIFNLRYIQLMTWKEISNKLDVSVSWCIKNHNEYVEMLKI